MIRDNNNLIELKKENHITSLDYFIEQKVNFIVNYLTRNAPYIFSHNDLVSVVKKSINGEKVVLKWGIDPTFPSMHIGHLVPLKKIKEFLFFLPNVSLNIILGTGTTLLHDPGRIKNKSIDLQTAIYNSEKIKQQISFFFRGYEKNLTFIYNHLFLESIDWKLFLSITSRVKIVDVVKKFGSDINLSNAIYPVFQAYDSIKTDADIEFGGTDQIMNILSGRDAGRNLGLKQQVGFFTGLIPHGNGKMSKSSGRAVFLSNSEEDILNALLKMSDEDFLSMMSCFGYSCNDMTLENMNKNKKQFVYKLLMETIPTSKNFENILNEEFSGVFFIDFVPKDIFTLIKLIKPTVSNTHIKSLIKCNAISIDDVLVNKFSSFDLKILNNSFTLKYGRKIYVIKCEKNE